MKAPATQTPILSLRAYAETMHRFLRGERSVDDTAATLGVARERAAIYQDFVRGHIRLALEKNYPVLATALPQDLWDLLVRTYFAHCPADAFELNACARQFPSFLWGLAENQSWDITAVHAEIAEVEWAEWLAYGSPTDIPSPETRDVDCLNPTLQVLQCTYPVLGFIHAWRRWLNHNRQGEAPPWPSETRSEIVFALRHPVTQGFRSLVADDGLLFALKVVHEGIGLEEAAAGAGIEANAAQSLLEHAASEGVILRPQSAA